MAIGPLSASQYVRLLRQDSGTKTLTGANASNSVHSDGSAEPFDENSYRLRLEKHLTDYAAGDGHLSSNMQGVLANKREKNALYLGTSNPKAVALYDSYLTANLGYSQKARFVSGVATAARTQAQIFALSKKA